jgi:hypothetical protein
MKTITYLGMSMGIASMLGDAFYLDKPSKKHCGVCVDVRTEPKIGRNEPCPCGSGKKYKKCCRLKRKEN